MKRARVIIKRGRARPLWHGHPWVYSEAIKSVEGEGVAPGDEVLVVDEDGHSIGAGYLSPRSQIRVRLISRGEQLADEALLRARIAEAIDLRRRLDLPSAETSCYRLINSEGDGLPGLVVDVYGEVLAVSFTTCGMKRRDALVLRILEELTGASVLLELPARGVSIDNEGFTAVAEVRKGSLDAGLGGAAPGHVRVREAGLLFDVEPLAAQKTGLFLDQRDNRALVARLSRGAQVLDCFSYVGGFALACARGGATEVVAVDSSERACERARAHAELNGLADRVRVEHEDVFRWLRAAPSGPAADLCILDPPKFARKVADLEQALGHYEQLNALALGRIAPGGFLVTASCSGAVDEQGFERMLVQAAKRAGRRLQLVERRGAGPNHPTPAGFDEGRYLKVFVLRVS